MRRFVSALAPAVFPGLLLGFAAFASANPLGHFGDMQAAEDAHAFWIPPWQAALLLALLVEVPVVAAFFPGQRRKLAAVAVAANVVTVPALNLALPRMAVAGHFALPAYVLPGEALVVAIEAAAYALASRPHRIVRSLLASLVANLLSFVAGAIVLGGLGIGWP